MNSLIKTAMPLALILVGCASNSQDSASTESEVRCVVHMESPATTRNGTCLVEVTYSVTCSQDSDYSTLVVGYDGVARDGERGLSGFYQDSFALCGAKGLQEATWTAGVPIDCGYLEGASLRPVGVLSSAPSAIGTECEVQ